MNSFVHKKVKLWRDIVVKLHWLRKDRVKCNSLKFPLGMSVKKVFDLYSLNPFKNICSVRVIFEDFILPEG